MMTTMATRIQIFGDISMLLPNNHSKYSTVLLCARALWRRAQ